jgi:choline kinase
MKVVILAAGLGSRLNASVDHLPKCLTVLDNRKSILWYQLQTLSNHLSLDQVMIVVGYQKEAIMEAFPNLLYVYNPNFAVENTSKSLEKALKKVDEDVLWLNGDVIFKSSVIQTVLKSQKTGMVVNQGNVGEEEVKYRTHPQECIIEVSKQVQSPEGEALGINFFKKEDLDWLKKNLVLCQANDYFEKAIELGLQQHVVCPIRIEVNDCAEIDFPEDLRRANQLLALWQNASKISLES